jgi:hypothetical protein
VNSRTSALLVLVCILGLAGCYAQDNAVDLGNVSIGQQLIDLQRAKESEAISEAEYSRLREMILAGLLDDEETREP